MTERARYACLPDQSRGRRFVEVGGEVRGPRTAFQRDRDRIIHSISFRRLRHKTQVFIAPDGDHFRVRLTHSLEVAQIGRTIARALGLDEDLTEALCLAHDIGHPPFGHAGEDALEAALSHAGGFDHNGHVLRILSELECPYPLWDGLNLSWEMLEGLAKHNGPVHQPGWALSKVNQAYDLALTSHSSLEAQVAAIADDIAYDNHDIDDGLRAGLLNFDDMLAQPMLKSAWDGVVGRFPGGETKRLRAEMIRQLIGAMVTDVIAQSRDSIRDSGVESVNDVRNFGRGLISFSPHMRAQEADHKRFMYDRLYHHPSQMEAAAFSRMIVSGLFEAYADDPRALPDDWARTVPSDGVGRARHIADFIAGMTDRFAVDRYCEHVGPAAPPAGF